MRAAALALGLLLGTAATAAAEDTVAHAVFDPGWFARITAPVDLRYRYETRGRGLDGTPPSPVRVEVREVAADGGKQVWLDLFEGEAHREVGPVAAQEQNPLVILFLQLDVAEMGRLTGGAAGYFQQQIRKAFSAPTTSEPVTVELDGQAVPATRITLRPFQNDPHLDRFPQFRDKSYVFTVAGDVPGGIWQVMASTPDPQSGAPVLEKSMTFEAAQPRG